MLGDTSSIERKLDTLIQEIQALRALMKELVNNQPRCTCLGHEAGETWLCEIHGYVARTDGRIQ